MKNLMVSATLLLSGLSAQAADSAAVELKGLSKDGRFAAFETYGIQDGSGFTYADYTFLDVDNNKFAASPIHVVDEDPIFEVGLGLTRPRANAAKKADPILKRLGILEVSKLEAAKLRKVVSRSPFEDTTTVKEVSFTNRGLFWQASHYLNRVTLKLSTMELPCPNPNGFCGSIGSENNKATGIKLDLESISHREDKYQYTKTLQLDERVPPGRSYVHSYFLKDVYVYDPEVAFIDDAVIPESAKIIVTVGMLAQGFEGSNMDYMFVSGKLK